MASSPPVSILSINAAKPVSRRSRNATLDALPRLPNKKIGKKQLRAPDWAGIDRQVP